MAQARWDMGALRPIDDLMFRVMARDEAFCGELLGVLLRDPGLEVVECKPQSAVTNPQGRSAVLDALCELSDGRFVDVEVQRADDDDLQRRVRYYASLVTADRTRPGGRFADVPDVCVALVCEFDPLGEGCSLYHVDRVVRESGRTLENGLSELYVNALARDGGEVSALMRVFTEAEAYDEERFPETSRVKRRLRETEEGRKDMGSVIEEIREEIRAECIAEGIETGRAEGIETGRAEGIETGRAEGIAEGEARGEVRGTLKTLVRLVRDGLVSVQDAAASAGVDADEIRRTLAAEG